MRLPQILGKGLFQTHDGKIIELPKDMTAEEAARLEAEALAAQKKIGKGPPPQPVPDVKKLDKKEDKKTQLKAPPKKKPPQGKGKRARGGGAGAMMKAVGTSKVAQYLVSKAAPVVNKGFTKLDQLRTNQQTHDSADEKRAQSEQAQVIPDSEGQSKSNTGQVNVVSDRPAPKVDPNKGKQTLQQNLRENVPQTIEDVDNFKRDKKAQHTGAEVLKVVQTDKSAVVSTFQDMGTTPPPAPREFEPEPLPPPEATPGTAALTLGKDGIAPLQKEHTDLSNFTKEADSKLKEEGVTQEQLDMVDSGDLATANKEKKGMEKSAITEPLTVQKFSQEQNKKVENDLKQEETKKRSDMNSKRKAGLGVTGQKQKNTKSSLEKKREEVATKINGIYTTAQDKVKKKLADLETASMKRFDDGNNTATKYFEDTVNRELDAFKADRYSGWFGWARKAKDWLLGMDDLPGVKAIFDRNREKFVTTINKLVEDITADNKKVIQECKDDLQKARTEIKDYVDKLGPSLKDIGKKAAEEMSSKLDEMDKFIAKKEEDLQNQLKDKQTAAIKAIDEKIEKMKEAMAGALAKLGKLLLWAAKKFFTWALEKFGFSLGDIETIINKGAAVLKAIFTKPIQFVKNLMSAAISGFKNFGKNFLKHLQDAVFDWLTGSIEGFQLPTTWDFKGIISVALQLIGISYANIRRHMVSVMGEPVVVGLEKSFTLVKTLITEGPLAAWEQLKDMATDIKEAFIQAVKEFIAQKIIEQAIQWIVGIFVPGAGIIKAIIGIYDTIVFFIKKAKDIIKMVGNFLGSVSEIAAGNIGAAAEAMEQGLARGLLLVVNFLAALLRLGGVTAKIRAVLQKIRAKVDDVLLKVAKWIATKAKAIISKVVGAVKGAVGSVTQWWKRRKKFKGGDGQTHSVVFHGEGRAARLWVESDPTPFATFISDVKADVSPQKEAKARALITAKEMDELRNKASVTDGTLSDPDTLKLQALWDKLADDVAILFAGGAPTEPKYGPPASPTQWGSGMVILNLKDPKHGSRPTVSDQHFKDLNIRRYGNVTSNSTDSYYILGHLLNEQLGGPGNKWQNLTPLSRKGNAQHVTQVETDVKAEAKSKIVRYEVQARYGRAASALLATIPANTTDAVLMNKRKVLLAEQYVPSTLLCRAYTVDASGKPVGGFNLTKEVLNKVDDSSLDDYNVPGQAVQRLTKLAINDAIKKAHAGEKKYTDALMLLPGIGPTRIVDLINGGKAWGKWEDFWKGVNGVTKETTDDWRTNGIAGGAVTVTLNGTCEWV
ncbi:MAG TPA: DNA/RNA non-specific endonuclease [Pyrinomonadaceae bacterium]|nr:DNA/RNA non-specific endonuclease [Pyrinomonadaceae bacterium]